MGITAAHTLFPKHFKRLSILAFLMLSLATAVQSAPRNDVQKPPVDTSTMPDSINRLIENIFSLIDSLEIKDSTRVDMHIDTTRLVRDTIIVTTQFVEDSIISAELMHQIDSIVGKDILTQAPDKPRTDTLALASKAKKDTLRKIMPKPKPLQMCARAQAILQESKNRFTITPSNEIPVNPIFLPIIFKDDAASNVTRERLSEASSTSSGIMTSHTLQIQPWHTRRYLFNTRQPATLKSELTSKLENSLEDIQKINHHQQKQHSQVSESKREGKKKIPRFRSPK